MLVVRVEVWPSGYEDRKHVVSEMRLANVSNLTDISDYIGAVYERENVHLNIPEMKCEFEIKGYPRKQSVWNLIQLAISQLTKP